MTKHRIHFDIYIKSSEARDELAQSIVANHKLPLNSEALDCKDIQVDDLISFWADSEDPDSLKGSFRKWLKPHKVDAAIVTMPDNHYPEETNFGVIGGKAATYPKALKEISAASPRARNSLAISSKTGKRLLKYIKDNKVDPVEVFVGRKLIDKCLDYSQDAIVSYFISEGLIIPNHLVSHQADPDYLTALIHNILHFDDVQSIKQLLEQGVDPNALDEYGNNLLHLVSESYFSVEKSRMLLEFGIDPNQQDSDGANALMITVRSCADWDGKELKGLYEYLELLRSYKARADMLDNKGSGILIDLKGNPKLTQWLYENFPEIKNTEATLNDESLIMSTFDYDEGTLGFYNECLVHNLLAPFESSAFKAMFESVEGTESERKLAADMTAVFVVQLALRFDQPLLLEKVHSFGFPLLRRATIEYDEDEDGERDFQFNTVGAAHKLGAKKVIAYLVEQGITEDVCVKIAQKLASWCESMQPLLGDIKTIKQFGSSEWIRETTIIWEERMKGHRELDEWLTTKFGFVVDEAQKPRAMDYVRGADRFLFSASGRPGLIANKNGYQVTSANEVLAK